MFLLDFQKALSQFFDPRFRAVLFKAVGLTLLLLIAVYIIFWFVVGALVPAAIVLPMIGEVTFVDTLASFGAVLAMMFASIFLMVPVATAFAGFFLDDVAEAVEARYYPNLPKVHPLPMREQLMDSLKFLGVLIVANLLALIVYFAIPPFAPFAFWTVNGYLLGREYFTLTAMRRIGREGAMQMFRRHLIPIWMAGAMMAAALSIPVVNLLIPILGVATFTHMFHRVKR
ncbi:EI24 domain-containing protein [Paracoccaceae bacterium GXU_MW_L88]